MRSDAVIHLKEGRWATVEVKLFSPNRIEDGARNLKKLVNRIDTSIMNEPSFMVILTAGTHAFMREDGIYAVPITCLKP